MERLNLEHLERLYWVDLLAGVGVEGQAAEAGFRDLARRHAEPGRHYHTFDHVAEVVQTVAELARGNFVAGPALFLAAWFHDAIYDPRAHDNEARSAEYATEVLANLGVPPPLIRETARLIQLTRTHETAEDDLQGWALLDADLAILGADPERYERYAAAIRQEYAWVPEAEYKRGRAAVLEKFLARPRIYQTKKIGAEREQVACANLVREIAGLK